MPPRKKKARPKPIYFETTIPSIRACRKCGVWVAAGVVEGQKAEVEIVALTPVQAAEAVLRRIELYVLRRTGLIHMDLTRLSGRHLGRLMPQHHCSVKWVSQVEGAGREALVRRYDEKPPY